METEPPYAATSGGRFWLQIQIRPQAQAGKTLFRPNERDLPHLAVTVRHFDPPALPAGDAALFQVMDDLEGLFACRLIVGQKLRCFPVIDAVAVAERETVEGYGPIE
jgi:hypothetical protein